MAIFQTQLLAFFLIANYFIVTKAQNLSTINATCFQLDPNAIAKTTYKDPCHFDCMKGRNKLSTKNIVPNMESCRNYKKIPKVCLGESCVFMENVHLCGNLPNKVLSGIVEMSCYVMCLFDGLDNQPSDAKHVLKPNGTLCQAPAKEETPHQIKRVIMVENNPGTCQNGECEPLK